VKERYSVLPKLVEGNLVYVVEARSGYNFLFASNLVVSIFNGVIAR
jgi:hypothetical protein